MKLLKKSKNAAPRGPARVAVFPALRGLLMSSRRVPDIYVGLHQRPYRSARCANRPSPWGFDSLKTPRNCRTPRADHVLLSQTSTRFARTPLPLNLDTLEFHQLVDRVRSEFLEMPGLRLTLPQAARLWGLDPPSCEAVVDALIRSAFLQRTATGAVTRVDG